MDADDYGEQRPLSNADFRRLLETPRPGAGKKEAGEKKKRPKGVKPQKPKPGPEGDADDAGYRDRAAERRKGVNADFDAIPEDLANILQGGQGGLNKLSYEESKFLGGDIAHTHLVKGLDFALLQKIRAEQEAKRRAGGEESSDEEEVPAAPLQPQEPAKFATPLGRAVHAFFFDPKQRRTRGDVAQMFLPRRTAFVYEMEDPLGPDLPTMLRRSKEDCPKVHETVLGAVDGSVLERIAKIMSYMSMAGGKKKIKKKDKLQLLQGIHADGDKPAKPELGSTNGITARSPAGMAGTAGAAAGGGSTAGAALPSGAASGDDDDGDIFADAGTDYVVQRRKDKERAAAAAAVVAGGAGSYFDRREDESDLPPLPAAEGPAPPPPPPPTGDDMDLGDDLAPAPPPPPAPSTAEAGPALPPGGVCDCPADYSAAYPDTDAAYGAYPNTDEAYGGAAALAGAELGDVGAVVAAAVSAAQPPPGTGAVFKRDEGALRRRQQGGNDGEDAYAECYPSYYEYAGTVVDSDDEEGAGATRAGADKGVGLSRLDFASEEEYREYVAANPQRAAAAAGGGGGKGDGGRKAQREATKRDSRQQQKLSSQLDKIQKIMEDKGYDHNAAFRGGKGGAGEGGALGEPPMPTKRRRVLG